MSTKMKCPRCPNSFDLDETRARFNHQYAGGADWNYDTDVSQPMCGDCAEDDVNHRWMDGTLKAADGDPPEEYLAAWRRQRR